MLTQRIALYAAGGVALLVLVALGVFALMPGGGSDAGDLSPLVIVDGERLDPPYEVTRSGADVLVNDVRAQSLAPVTNTSTVGAPAAGDDVFTIVEQAGQASDAAGGGDAGADAALALLAAHPADPTFERVSEPNRIQVTDAAGLTADLQYEVPDTEARAVTDGGEEAAAAVAEQWKAHLEAGGGIVASSTGVALLIPPTDVPAFDAALTAALGQSGSAKDAALTELLSAPALIEEHGGTPPSLEDYATAAALGRQGHDVHPVAGLARRAAEGDVVHLAAGSAKTPGKKQGYGLTFTTLNESDSYPYFDAIREEGYEALVYRNPTSAHSFASTSQTGALYNVTHSSPAGLSVALFPNNEDAARYSRLLQNNRVDRGLYRWWREGANGPWWLDLTPAGIRAFWRSNDTIVHSASCNGAGLAPAFAAREFFGYAIVTSCAIALPDTTKLWGRWSGKDGNGQYRSASLAWAQGGFHSGFRYVDGSPDGDTVLSPAVPVAELPDIIVGGQAAILIGFDALMDTSLPANQVIALTGCAVVQVEPQWQFQSLIVTQVTAESAGEYQVTVRQANAKSPAQIHLDGNQRPEVSGVIPNRDDHIAKGRCLAAEPTPTSGVDPRTPTPAISTGDALAEATPEVVVLVIEGEHFPAEQFIGAQADACDSAHYHAHQPVRSLEGTVIEEDPNPGECGFGRVSEVPTLTLYTTKQALDEWEEWAAGN